MLLLGAAVAARRLALALTAAPAAAAGQCATAAGVAAMPGLLTALQGHPWLLWKPSDAPARLLGGFSSSASGSSSSSAVSKSKRRERWTSSTGQNDSNSSNSSSRSSSRSSRRSPGASLTKGLGPKLLTARIKAAATLEQLESLVQQHGSAFEYIHLSAAFHHASHLARQAGGRVSGSSSSSREVHALMHQLWQHLEPQLDSCGPRQLSNIVWACSKVGYTEPPLVDGCLSRLAAARHAAEPQDLSNAVYAAALLDGCGCLLSDTAVLPRLVAALVEKRHQSAPQALSNTLWAAATVRLQLPEGQVQQLVAALVEQRHQAKPQELVNTLWAVATLRLQLPEGQVQQLVAALVEQRHQAKPQELVNTLWAVATLRLQLPEGQVQQLVAVLVEKQQQTKPQELSNTLWAAATLGLQLPEQQGQQLVAALVEQRHQAKPQELSNTLWAAATLGLQLPEQQGQQLVAALVEQRHQAKPQELSNTLWASAEMRICFPPLLQQLTEALLQVATQATSQNISNAALALAKLGCGRPSLFDGLVEAMQQRQPTLQSLTNLCWAVAVADQRQCAPQVLALCRHLTADPQMWGAAVDENFTQLHQVHLWLCDWQAPADTGDTRGLAGVLSPAQLQRCAQAWEAQLDEVARKRRSVLQRSVYACAQRLTTTLAGCREEERSALDGAFSIDVATTYAPTGLRLAIEADGPTHFLRPGRQLTGDTLARNRALAARGYVVVSVPWWEWDALKGRAEKEDRYLSAAVEAAIAAAAAAVRGGGSAAGNDPALTAAGPSKKRPAAPSEPDKRLKRKRKPNL